MSKKTSLYEIEERFPILPIIYKNQEQIYDNEEDVSGIVIDREAFTTTEASLHQDRVTNTEEIEIRKATL